MLLNVSGLSKSFTGPDGAVPVLQGVDLTPTIESADADVRDAAFSVAPMRRGFLIRQDGWAYIQYGEDGRGGAELFDMQHDPQQFHNLVDDPKHADRVKSFEKLLADKLIEVRTNDLKRGGQR